MSGVIQNSNNQFVILNDFDDEKVLDKILQSKELEIKYLVDFDAMKIGKKINNIPIISAYKYFNEMMDRNYIMLIPTNSVTRYSEIRRSIKSLTSNTNMVYWIPIQIVDDNSNFQFDDCIQFDDFCYLDYMEYSVCDHCNLKCRGCGHFANIVEGEVFQDYLTFEKDAKQLKSKIFHIKEIRILGGEPLLHKDLFNFCGLFRKLYPYAKINICTNGLLLNQLQEECMHFCKENSITFDISVYPVNKSIDEEIIRLREYGLEVYAENRYSFKPILLKEKKNVSYQKLYECDDVNMYNGYLAPCPIVINIKYFNKKYNSNYPENDELIYLYEEGLTGPDLIEKLDKPLKICEYCAYCECSLKDKAWEKTTGEASIADWYVEE